MQVSVCVYVRDFACMCVCVYSFIYPFDIGVCLECSQAKTESHP